VEGADGIASGNLLIQTAFAHALEFWIGNAVLDRKNSSG